MEGDYNAQNEENDNRTTHIVDIHTEPDQIEGIENQDVNENSQNIEEITSNNQNGVEQNENKQNNSKDIIDATNNIDVTVEGDNLPYQYLKEYSDVRHDSKLIQEKKIGMHDTVESSMEDEDNDTIAHRIKTFGVKGPIRSLIESGDSAMGDLFYMRKRTNRPEWSNRWEFLMSCIAMSVGLGNIWRFPFAAYENGGGAFLVPYIVVIFLVGQPMYYLEMILGQFSGRNSIRVWVLSPVLKGVGYGQLVATFCIVSYYVVLMALTLFYTYKSLETELPWAHCKPEWGADCYSASNKYNHLHTGGNKTSSSELFFIKEVLRETDSLDNGIGSPDWRLSACLILSWLGVFLVMMKGVRSSGKAAYILAILPYVILITILIKTLTLDGAMDGIYFFITPDWTQLYNPQVWYSAVTQVFFSLTVCIGAITMYSSFNNFRQPLYRDVLCVVLLDTITSLVAGFAIFGILGNLAHEKNVSNISEVIGSGGKTLAFVSFPDAIAKFDKVAQVFSVLFFFMLWVLGLGSAVSYQASIVTVLSDRFKRIPLWAITLVTCIITCLVGHVYITPGGQNILNLVDYFGGTFLVLCLSIVELVGISWVYGLENICEDIEFMTGKRVSGYWRWCWGVVTPLIMLFVLGYETTRYEIVKTIHSSSPLPIYFAVCSLMIFGLLQLPLWALIVYIKKRSSVIISARSICQPTTAWGPKDASDYQSWMLFKDTRRRMRDCKNFSKTKHLWYSLNGYYELPQLFK